jgi:hypothetical protein
MSSLGNAGERGGRDAEHEAVPVKQNMQDKSRADESARPTPNDATASDAKRWSQLMEVAFSETAFGEHEDPDASVAAAIDVGRELGHCLAAADADAGRENWEFTLDLGELGELEGRVSLEDGQVSVELMPRSRTLGRYLRKHRLMVETLASEEIDETIVVSIA